MLALIVTLSLSADPISQREADALIRAVIAEEMKNSEEHPVVVQSEISLDLSSLRRRFQKVGNSSWSHAPISKPKLERDGGSTT